MIFGLLGAGKTTLARRMEAEGAVRLSIDEWVIAASGDRVHLDDSLHARMTGQLTRFWPRVAATGTDVVLDFGFWRREDRDEVRRIAAEIGAESQLIWVRCSVEERRRRCLDRSGRDPDSYDLDAEAFDWISYNRVVEEPGPEEVHVVADTTHIVR